MSDTISQLDLIDSAQEGKEITANDLFNAASPSALYARRRSTTAALAWGYYGGRFNGNLIFAGTLAMTASTLNYIVADRSTGVLSASTSITNWNDTTNYIRTYIVDAGATSILGWQDFRQSFDNDYSSGVQRNAQTGTTYTLVASDINKLVDLSNAAAITLTLPANAIPGFRCTVIQSGAGQVTLSPAGSATLRNRQTHTKTAGQWAEIKLTVRANVGGSAAEYVMSGDTAA